MHHLRDEPGERSLLRVLPEGWRLLSFHGERIPVELVPEKSVLVWAVPFQPVETSSISRAFGHGLNISQGDVHILEHSQFNQNWEIYGENEIILTSFYKPKKVIYIHFDLLHSDYNVGSIAAEILEFFLAALEELPPERALIDIVMKQIEKGIDSKRNTLQQLKNREKEVLKEYTSIIRTIQQLQIELNGFKHNQEKLREMADRELKALKENQMIEKFSFREDGTFEFHTKDIYVNVDGIGKIYMGRYKVIIGANRSEPIKMINKNNKFKEYDHPHIKNGIPCLGTIKADLLKLIENYEYSTAAVVVINFLQSVYESSVLASVKNWIPQKEG